MWLTILAGFLTFLIMNCTGLSSFTVETWELLLMVGTFVPAIIVGLLSFRATHAFIDSRYAGAENDQLRRLIGMPASLIPVGLFFATWWAGLSFAKNLFCL
jgi:hypothetical protein